MEALTHPGGDREVSAPGEHETWQELAEHSVEHDQLSTDLPDPGAFSRHVAWRRRELGLGSPTRQAANEHAASCRAMPGLAG